MSYAPPDAPLIFLAGPIRGGGAWRQEATAILKRTDAGLCIASPAREGIIERLSEEDLRAQAEWESHHLELAGYRGAILFWLPCQREERSRGAYAQTTRIELGFWLAKIEDGAHLAIGAEEGFPGQRYIRYQVERAGLTLHPTLINTCQEALILTHPA